MTKLLPIFLLTLITISTTSLANNNQNTISNIQSKYTNSYVKENGIQYAHTMLNRLKGAIKTANVRPVLGKDNNGNPIAIMEWNINKKSFLNVISEPLKAYNGEQEDVTKSGRFINRKERSRLYFNLAPLGQHNGMTFLVNTNKSSKYSFLSELYANTKIFIKASTANSTIYTPILTSNSVNGCGNDIYSSKKEIICVQTTHPNDSEFNIGYKQGFNNKLPLLENESLNDITIEIVYFIGEEKF